MVTAQAYAYMVGGLTAAARRAASTSAETKAAEPGAAAAAAVATAPPEEAPTRRRRRTKVEMLGRGYEYMDLEPEPTVEPSDRAAGALGFPGTAHTATATVPAGLATLTDDAFGSGPHTPMMPGSWGGDSAPPDDT